MRLGREWYDASQYADANLAHCCPPFSTSPMRSDYVNPVQFCVSSACERSIDFYYSHNKDSLKGEAPRLGPVVDNFTTSIIKSGMWLSGSSSGGGGRQRCGVTVYP